MMRVFAIICGALLIFSCQVCHARQWEISPLIGCAIGGSFEEDGTDSSLRLRDSISTGLAVDVEYEKDTQIELYYSRQSTSLKTEEGTFSSHTLFDLDVHYIQIGGTYMWSTDEIPAEPYVVGTIGIAHLRPRSSGFDTVTRPSMGLGIGARVHVTRHLGIRMEARGFATFINSDAHVFSNSQGLSIRVRSDSLSQAVFNAGLCFDF